MRTMVDIEELKFRLAHSAKFGGDPESMVWSAFDDGELDNEQAIELFVYIRDELGGGQR